MSCKGTRDSGACTMTVIATITSRRGAYELCEWHAERHCDGCGKIDVEILYVASTSASGRAFRLCRKCSRKRMLAPALATSTGPRLIADKRAHPEYEAGAARLGMLLPAVCRIEGNARVEGSGAKQRQHAANAWEVACPTVAPYDRLASVLDERFSRKLRSLCPEMGEQIRSETTPNAPLRGDYAYWWIPVSALPLPSDAWWQRFTEAIPSTSVGAIAYEPPAVAQPKSAKRSRGRAA